MPPFDTLRYASRLQEAGLPAPQAEAMASALVEAFDSAHGRLATRADLATLESRMDARFDAMQRQMDARFDAQDDSIAARFAAQEARLDAKLDARDARFDAKWEAQEALLDARFATQEQKFHVRFATIDANFRVIHWMLGVLGAGVGALVLKAFA